MKMSDPRVRKNPDVAFQALAEGEGGVLLSLETGEYHGVNDTGGRIWNLIDGERTVPEIVAALRLELSGAPESLEVEATEFVESLRVRRLVMV
ncbi:MAG TPA: PqqD family protein [Gaiellaceae bacterium]